MLNVDKINKLSHLAFSTKKFLQFYKWDNCSPNRSINLNKSLNKCKIAIVSSAGLIIREMQKPFDSKIKRGDSSFRIIPSNINANDLEEHHRSKAFNHSGIKTYPFSVMPIPHLIDLQKEGLIGLVNDRHISLMGSIISTKKLKTHTIPRIIEIFKNDKIDIVIFIPI